MNLNQPTLIQFEQERRMNSFVPPAGSNSFYNIGNGRINIFTRVDESYGFKFDVFTDSGEVDLGPGSFYFTGDIDIAPEPYGNLTIIRETSMVLTNRLGIYSGKMESHGMFKMKEHSYLVIRNCGNVVFYRDSDFIIEKGCGIEIDDGCSLTIYGKIHIDFDTVDVLLNTPGVTVDSSAVMYVTGLEALGNRPYSLTDYYAELSNQVININTQGEKNFVRGIGRIGYKWVAGNPLKQYQIIQMSVLYNDAILGDFKLSVLGLPNEDLTNIQILRDLVVEENTTLYITESYNQHPYSHPELYIGSIIGNCKAAGRCDVRGKIIVDGSNAKINLDRGGLMHIDEGAEVHFLNGSQFVSTYNDESEVLFIDGTLVIEDISQIDTFDPNSIVFGEHGKLIILNPDTGERRVLWTTPHGLENTELYKLFKDRLNHIEYHISNNTGIAIDKYYEFYAKDFTNWYGGMRIEKAVHEGLLVWHDGGFIELSDIVIPWINSDCSLLEASRLFKTFGSYDHDKLQEAVNRLKYAGFGNITFIFVYMGGSHEVTLILDYTEMTNVINNPISNSYVLYTDKSGKLFIRNNLSVVSPETIITKEATMIDLDEKSTEFKLK